MKQMKIKKALLNNEKLIQNKEIDNLLSTARSSRFYSNGFVFECDIDYIADIVLEEGNPTQIMELLKLIKSPYSNNTPDCKKKEIDDHIYTEIGKVLTKKFGYEERI